MKPSVSVLIAAHNAASTLERCLNSVLAQTYPRLSQIIVINDGSTDETPAVVARYPGVTCISQENRGVTHSRARLVAMATGDFLAFLDADDAWLPEKLARQVAVMESRPEVALVTTQCVLALPGGRQRVPHWQGLEPVVIFDRYSWFELRRERRPRLRVVPSGWLVRREALTALGGWEHGLRDDWKVMMKLLGAGHQGALVTEPLTVYTRSPGSMSNVYSRDTWREGWLMELGWARELKGEGAEGTSQWRRYRRLMAEETLQRGRQMLLCGDLLAARSLWAESRSLQDNWWRRLALLPWVGALTVACGLGAGDIPAMFGIWQRWRWRLRRRG